MYRTNNEVFLSEIRQDALQKTDVSVVLTIVFAVELSRVRKFFITVNSNTQHSVVSLHLCKEYLTVVKYETQFSLLMKYWIISALMKYERLRTSKSRFLQINGE